jgi:hypothetical protein
MDITHIFPKTFLSIFKMPSSFHEDIPFYLDIRPFLSVNHRFVLPHSSNLKAFCWKPVQFLPSLLMEKNQLSVGFSCKVFYEI